MNLTDDEIDALIGGEMIDDEMVNDVEVNEEFLGS